MRNSAYIGLLTTLLLLVANSVAIAEDNLPSGFAPIILGENEESFDLDIKRFSWIDTDAEYHAADLLSRGTSGLKKAQDKNTLPPNAVLWTLIRFENQGKSNLQKHIQFDFFADSIGVFLIKNGEINQVMRTGKSMSPPQKPFHSTNNYIPIDIDAGETKSMIIRQSAIKQRAISTLTTLQIHPSHKLIKQRLMTFSIQAFYLGLLLIMSIAGFIKGYFSKRKLYLYFSLFILSLGLFFPFYYGLLDDLLLYVLHNKYVALGELIFTGIVLFGTLFFAQYFDLKNHSPHHYWTYLVLALFSEITAHLMFLFTPDFPLLFQIRYFLAFLWLSASIYLCIRQIFREQRKKYLLSFLAMTMGTGFFIMIVSIFEPNFYDFHLYFSFQIAAFCFSAILFYDLFRAEKQPLIENPEPISNQISNEEETFEKPNQNTGNNNSKNDIKSLLETANAADKSFLEKICETIDKHIDDPSFSVEVLATEIGYSRVHLNRKLKASCHLSANKFILQYRLSIAHEMLSGGAYNVNEAAHKTGFSSTSYFVKCFRDKYGKTPGMLVKE